MGWFKRLIGKAVGSETAKRLIGKASEVGKKLIGTNQHAHSKIKSVPVIGEAAQHIEDALRKSDSAKAAYHVAKDYLDTGEDYAAGRIGQKQVKQRLGNAHDDYRSRKRHGYAMRQELPFGNDY